MEEAARVPSGPDYSTFSGPTKRWIIAIITCASFVPPFTATIYFPALNSLSKDLDVSIGLINLSITTYMIFQAVSPTFIGDFGDMAGRRPAYIVAFLIYSVANLGLALQNNYIALLILRMLQSAGNGGVMALSFGSVADLAVSGERGKYMGIMGAGINIGAAVGPILGGVLSQYLGWRAIFWFCFIYGATWLIPFTLFVPETCRNVVGNGSIPARGWNMTLLDVFRRRQSKGQDENSKDLTPARKLRFPNPFNVLRVAIEKDLSLLLFYSTSVNIVFILICATLSTEFASIYGYSDVIIGLCYIPYGVGCCLAAVAQGPILDGNYRRTARRIGFTIDYRRGDDLRNFPIEEARLLPVCPMLLAGIIAVITYGWLLQAEVSIVGPLVLLFFVGFCITGAFCVLNTLLVDVYPEAPASAVAACNFVRCILGAGATAVVEPMLRSMGRGWTYTFWALIPLVFSPVLWVLVKRGPKWREERRVRKSAEEEKRVAASGSGSDKE